MSKPCITRGGTAALAAAACLALAAPAGASQVVGGWWDGLWSCRIDGRPARMSWRVVDDTRTQCQGDICTTVAGATYRGRFSDNGSPWVPLKRLSRGNEGGIFFTHADGNRWYLARPQNGRARGHTTWNGQRYPLECWH